MRASDRLSKYDDVLTFSVFINGKRVTVPLYKAIEKFLFIEDVEGRKIPFILNDDQVTLYEEMCKQRLEGQPIRIDILKARQKGFSTFIAGVIFCSVIFNRGQKAAIVADIAEHATNLFAKYNFFYENLPPELQFKKKASNAKELVVQYANGQTSSIRIMVQGDAAGRSGTYQFLHLSECAFWQDLQSTLVSLLQTVSSSNMNSMVFLETTANGVNDYKTRWDNDFAGKSRYKALFFPWFTTERYMVEDRYIRDFDVPLWLQEYIDKYNINKNQQAWFYDRYNEFNGDLDRLRQEFPSNPVEAFVTSGNSVFNADLTRIRKEEILKTPPLKVGFYTFEAFHSLDGKKTDVKNIKWLETRAGSIKIYEEPVEGHPYVVSNDPANGGEDYFATQVFDNYTGHQVAVYHRNKCDADDAAYQMYCLATEYNNALITGETNTTSYLLEVCAKCGYRHLYQDQDVEDLSGRYANKYGYKTKQNNRQYMIDLFKIAFRENPKIINDYETICEMESFQVVKHANGSEKAEASGGAHDDLVMSVCGYFLCRGSQSAVPSKAFEPKRKTIDQIAMEREEMFRKKKEDKRRNVYQIWD